MYKSYQNQEKNRFRDWTITNMTLQAFVFTIVHVFYHSFRYAVVTIVFFFSFLFFSFLSFLKEVNTASLHLEIEFTHQ